MENTGVTCDVCECRHNVEACKCDLPQIKVTEHCTCSSQQVDTPHYCQELREEVTSPAQKIPAEPFSQRPGGDFADTKR